MLILTKDALYRLSYSSKRRIHAGFRDFARFLELLNCQTAVKIIEIAVNLKGGMRFLTKDTLYRLRYSNKWR